MRATISRIRSGETVTPSSLLDELSEHFPLISELANTPQDSEWHAEGDVRTHTEMVIAEAIAIAESSLGAQLSADERLVLILGAALHDIGKALTTREATIDGKTRIVSPHHPERGRSYLAPRMPSLGIPWALCDRILSLVGYHHAPAKLVVRGKSRHDFFALARAVDFQLVYLVELADLRGRILAIDSNDRDGFETLDLFRQSAKQFKLWSENVGLYEDWKQHIFNAIESETEARFTLCKGIHDFESGIIFTPDEAIARAYEWRSNHPELIMMCGVSGSGKSQWIQEHGEGFEIIALDDLRRQITGKSSDQKKNGQVLQRAKEEFRQHLRTKKKVIWDATAIRRDGRSMIIDLAHDYHATSRIVAVACPPSQIKQQNKSRSRQVSNEVIAKQFERLQWPEVWEADSVLVHTSHPTQHSD